MQEKAGMETEKPRNNAGLLISSAATDFL